MFLYDDKTWTPHLRTSTSSTLLFETSKPVGSASCAGKRHRWRRGRGSVGSYSRLRVIEQLVSCKQPHLLPASHQQRLPGPASTARCVAPAFGGGQLCTAQGRPAASAAPGPDPAASLRRTPAARHSRLLCHLHRRRWRRQSLRRSLRAVREFLPLLFAGDEHSRHPDWYSNGDGRFHFAQPEERRQPGGADLHRLSDRARLRPAAVRAVLRTSQSDPAPAAGEEGRGGPGAGEGGRGYTTANARTASASVATQASWLSPVRAHSSSKRSEWTPVVAA